MATLTKVVDPYFERGFEHGVYAAVRVSDAKLGECLAGSLNKEAKRKYKDGYDRGFFAGYNQTLRKRLDELQAKNAASSRQDQ